MQALEYVFQIFRSDTEMPKLQDFTTESAKIESTEREMPRSVYSIYCIKQCLCLICEIETVNTHARVKKLIKTLLVLNTCCTCRHLRLIRKRLLNYFVFSGEALADGSTINWKHFNAADGMTEEHVEAMTSEQMKVAEDECMMRNAWKVCEDVCNRIDGEPAPSGDMTAYVTHKEGIIDFFTNVMLL